MTHALVRRALALCFLFALVPFSRAQNQEVSYAFPGSLRTVGPVTVHVGSTRVIAWEARTPLLTSFRDGTMVLTVGNPAVSTNIRSTDFGQWWEPQQQYLGYLNTVERSDGTLLVIDYDLRLVSAATGTYRVDRWTSTNKGATLGPPNTSGRATLPTVAYAPSNPHWINDVIEMPNGHLLAVVQSLSPGATSTNSPWDVALLESADGGANWTFKSAVASKDTVVDPAGLLTARGWPLYWATEPALVHTGGDHLVCVMRTVNDETAQTSEKIGPPMSKYHDLSSTVPGSGIYTGVLNLPANAFYRPGPPNAPLLIAHSTDGGATWGPATPMTTARGVFPRLATDGAGTLALSFGGLSGVPRWGHAITFSFDGGHTWTREVEFGPFLTTGYTALAAAGPGHFVCFFDSTPPQPWTSYQRWWTGVVDITLPSVTRSSDPTHATAR